MSDFLSQLRRRLAIVRSQTPGVWSPHISEDINWAPLTPAQRDLVCLLVNKASEIEALVTAVKESASLRHATNHWCDPEAGLECNVCRALAALNTMEPAE